MLSVTFVIVCGLFEWKWIWVYFLWYCQRRSSHQERRVGIPLTDLTPPHLCACPKPGPGFPMSHVVVFLCWWEMDCFVDIVGIDDHQCLSFLFIIWVYEAPIKLRLVYLVLYNSTIWIKNELQTNWQYEFLKISWNKMPLCVNVACSVSNHWWLK